MVFRSVAILMKEFDRREIVAGQIPSFWRRFLAAVAIGKGAIAGAGVAVGALAALDVAYAITAQDWIRSIQHSYLDEVAIGGGIIGAMVRAFVLR